MPIPATLRPTATKYSMTAVMVNLEVHLSSALHAGYGAAHVWDTTAVCKMR